MVLEQLACTPLRVRQVDERASESGSMMLTPRYTPDGASLRRREAGGVGASSGGEFKTPGPVSKTRSLHSAKRDENKGTPVSRSRSDYAFISHSPSTYPQAEPDIDNAQLARRKRRRTSAMELAVLEEEFSKNLKPNKEQRERISKRVGMTEKAVQIWFQNKRQSHRKQQLRGTQVSRSSSFPSARPKTPSATPAAATASSSSFRIYDDNFSRLKLSMSDDGKAQVVPMKRAKLALSPVKGSTLNSRQPLSPKSPTKQRRQMADKEKECVSNLLSLRSGIWN